MTGQVDVRSFEVGDQVWVGCICSCYTICNGSGLSLSREGGKDEGAISSMAADGSSAEIKRNCLFSGSKKDIGGYSFNFIAILIQQERRYCVCSGICDLSRNNNSEFIKFSTSGFINTRIRIIS